MLKVWSCSLFLCRSSSASASRRLNSSMAHAPISFPKFSTVFLSSGFFLSCNACSDEKVTKQGTHLDKGDERHNSMRHQIQLSTEFLDIQILLMLFLSFLGSKGGRWWSPETTFLLGRWQDFFRAEECSKAEALPWCFTGFFWEGRGQKFGVTSDEWPNSLWSFSQIPKKPFCTHCGKTFIDGH